MRNPIRATPLTGHHVPDLTGPRLLGIFVVAQAIRDVTGPSRVAGTHRRDHALYWLNSQEGRGIAGALGLPWADKPAPITVEDLPPARQVKMFWGNL